MFFGKLRTMMIFGNGDDSGIVYHLQLEHNTYVKTSSGLDFMLV